MTELIESTHLAASGQIKGSRGTVYGLILNGGSANSTVELAPATAGGGTAKIKASCVIAGSCSIAIPNGVVFDKGIYATLGGAGASVTVLHD